MNPITKALDEVKFRIPSPVLKETFKDSGYSWRSHPVSIDDQILNKVIRSRVMVDCNLVGGSETYISLEGLTPEYVNNVQVVYHIPKDRTGGRTIVSPLSVGYINYAAAYNSSGLGVVQPKSVTDTNNAANSVMMSHSSVPPITSANVELIAENTILIRDSMRVTSHNSLRCVLDNDSNMNNIQWRSIPSFCRLVELAVKAYVYNEMSVKIAEAKLSGGQELGRFKEFVDEYADSEEMYQEYLRDNWAKVSYMNDNMAVTRFIKLQLGPMK